MTGLDYSVLRDQIIGALSVAECQKLAEVAAASGATMALEVGHFYGLSTVVLLDALPAGCELVTVDHHLGDPWAGAVPPERFMANVDRYVGDRPFHFVNEDMRIALPELDGPFEFVFYDADHSAEAVADFWAGAADVLAHHCTLVFDDADWLEQATLRDLAEAEGFRVVTSEPFHRGDLDKADPSTYTLEVMRRG